MKVTTLLGAPFLIGGALAGGLESDALTAKGLLNLKEHIAQNGFPSPDTCTWKNVAHRREWYHRGVLSMQLFTYTILGRDSRDPRS